MKTKILTVIVLILGIAHSYAQNPIPNQSFEEWISGPWGDYPDKWASNSLVVVCGGAFKDTVAFAGNFAMHLSTGGCTGFAYTGFPLIIHPENLNAHIKAIHSDEDTLLIRISLLNNGLVVDSGLWNHVSIGNDSLFQNISIPITQYSSMIDSAIIHIESGNKLGSQLIVDELSFDFFSSTEEIENTSFIKAYPNPFDDFTMIEFEQKIGENYTLALYNSAGEVILKVYNIINGKIRLRKENLVNGIYFYQVYCHGLIKGKGKLIIE